METPVLYSNHRVLELRFEFRDEQGRWWQIARVRISSDPNVVET